MGVSFKPSDQSKASMWEGGPGTINTLRAVTWDYNGTGDPGPFIHANITRHEDGKEIDEYYGAGDASRFKPSEDGLTFEPLKPNIKGLSDSCNAAHLINSLVAAGFSEDDLADDLSIFDDMDVNFARQAIQRKIKGQEQTSNPLLVTEITRMPGEKKKPTGKPGTKAAPAAPAGKAAPAKAAPAKGKAKDAENEEKLQDAIAEILESNNPVSKKKLGQLVFAKFKKDPDVKALQALAADDDYLGGDERPWVYDAGEESLSV